VLAGVIQVRRGGRELRLERGRDLGVLGAGRGGVGLPGDRADQRGDPGCADLGTFGGQVPGVVSVMPTSA